MLLRHEMSKSTYSGLMFDETSVKDAYQVRSNTSLQALGLKTQTSDPHRPSGLSVEGRKQTSIPRLKMKTFKRSETLCEAKLDSHTILSPVQERPKSMIEEVSVNDNTRRKKKIDNAVMILREFNIQSMTGTSTASPNRSMRDTDAFMVTSPGINRSTKRNSPTKPTEKKVKTRPKTK